MARRLDDAVDALIEEWRAVRPDLELDAMATLGRLGRTTAVAGRAIEAVLGDHGLTIGEFDVLASLRRAGEPPARTPTALARAAMLSPAGMTNRIDRLEAAGLVERRPDPDDRRSSTVVLTPAGRRLVDAAVTDHVANEERLLAGLNPAERRRLDELLRKLHRHLEALEA